MISKCFSWMLTKAVIELEIKCRNSTLIKISLPFFFLTDETLSRHATLLSVHNTPCFNGYKAIVRSKLCIQPQLKSFSAESDWQPPIRLNL